MDLATKDQDDDHGGSGVVRALARGLAILRYVNAAGAAKPSDIGAALNIPRSTVYRLLQTLEEHKYVALSSSDNRVRVTRLAASLGDSYEVSSRLCQIVGPLFGEFGPKLVWPLVFSIYDDAAMLIEETTHGRSSLSVDRDMIGARVPMLRTSAGRAYLAHCGDEERELIIDHIRRLDNEEDRPFLVETTLRQMLARPAERGFALRVSGEFRPKTASVSVPVLSSSGVIGCISLIWVHGAMSSELAISKYLPSMQEIARRLADAAESD